MVDRLDAKGVGLDGIELNVDRQGATATIGVAGDIDLTSAPRLDDEVTGLIEDSVNSLTIELTGVSFMDSTGLRVLLKASKLLDSSGGTLVLRDPSDAVRRLLEVSGLDSHFEIAT
jgi:anti-sigma B factor antagonist